MALFGRARLGRAAYAGLLLLVFAFDIVQTPVAQTLLGGQEVRMSDFLAWAPVPLSATQSDSLADETGKEATEVAGRPEQAAGDDQNLQVSTAMDALGMSPDSLPDMSPRTGNSEAQQWPFWLLTMAMATVSLVAPIYLIRARLRDIGWPQMLLWVILAPAVPMQVPGLSELSAAGLVLSTAAALALAFVPSGGFAAGMWLPGDDPEPISRPRPPAPVAPAGQHSVRFGRLGSR